MSDRDDRVRQIAYFLWLDKGSPEGEAERHWLAAEGLIEPDPAEGQILSKGSVSRAALLTGKKSHSWR